MVINKAGFVNMPKAEYDAAIATARAEGRIEGERAAAARVPAPAPQQTNEQRIAAIKDIHLASSYPAVVQEAIDSGKTFAEACSAILTAHAAATGRGTSERVIPSLDSAEASRQQRIAQQEANDRAMQEASSRVFKVGQYQGQQKTMGRELSYLQADQEMVQQGLLPG